MKRLAVLAVIWGWSFVFIKVAVEGMTPTTVAFGRLTLGSLTLLCIVRATGEALPRSARFWRAAAVPGVVGTALPFTLLAWAEQRISSGLTSVAQATTSLFAAVFAAVLLDERLRRPQVAGLLLGLAGVAVMQALVLRLARGALEHALEHRLQIRPRFPDRRQRQSPARRVRHRGGIVEAVCAGKDRVAERAVGPQAEAPALLEPADVADFPERRVDDRQARPEQPLAREGRRDPRGPLAARPQAFG